MIVMNVKMQNGSVQKVQKYLNNSKFADSKFQIENFAVLLERHRHFPEIFCSKGSTEFSSVECNVA